MTQTYRNPTPTVDIIIEWGPERGNVVGKRSGPSSILLIERLNEPFGWALPGGFMDYGECAATAAIREAKEETNLDITLVEQFHCYSDPRRDPRQHTLSIVFIATATGEPKAMDDAKALRHFEITELPAQLCFDHGQILADYRRYRESGERPKL